MTYLKATQLEKLLQPINPARVLTLKKGSTGLSYVAQHDIRAHMNRIFGFGRWSTDVIETAFMFEEQVTTAQGKPAHVACYRATVKVTVHNPDGTYLAHYTDSHASGNAPQPDRAEAHALALTIAVSTAMKRACTCLGDQFGLSLYNKGQKTAFVGGTLIGVEDGQVVESTVVSLGEDPDAQPDEDGPALNVERPASPISEEFIERLKAATAVADIADRLQLSIDLKTEADALGYTPDMVVNPDSGFTLGKVFDLISKGK